MFLKAFSCILICAHCLLSLRWKLLRSLAPFSLLSSVRHLYTFLIAPQACSSRVWSPRSLSLSSYNWCSDPFIWCLDRLNPQVLVACTEKHGTGCQMWSHQVLIEKNIHLPYPAGRPCAVQLLAFFLSRVHCWLMKTLCPPRPWGLFLRRRFPASWPPSYTGVWSYSSKALRLCTSLIVIFFFLLIPIFGSTVTWWLSSRINW